MPVDIGLLRAKVAKMKPETRIRLGLGDRVDSVKVGLAPRASAPSDKEAALQRMVEAGTITEAGRDSSLAGFTPARGKEAAVNRLIEGGQINAAKGDSLMAGLRPEKPKTYAQILADKKADAMLRYAMNPHRPMSPTDSVLTGTKEEPKAGRSLTQAGQEYAKRQIDAQALLDAKNKDDGYVFLGGTPEVKNLQKVKQVYGDSSAIVSRALETFGPENDQNELIGMFPVARQGLQEYGKMIKGKMPEAQAAAAIKAKYGYDPADLRKVHYVETGK